MKNFIHLQGIAAAKKIDMRYQRVGIKISIR